MPFSYRAETRELNELARQEATGSFLQLSDGFTHYELSNPRLEDTVVLVHGFSVPYFIFDPTFEFLTRAGFRVLRYDLFGRGFSDRPQTRYNMDLFLRQLGDLWSALGFTFPVSLIGLSTGGPITASFTERFPGRVKNLVLIDPVGAREFALSRLLKAASLPILGEAIIGLAGNVPTARLIASRSVEGEHIAEFEQRYVTQLQYKGFRRAILSTIRNNMLGSCLEVYQRIGKMNKPVLLFWGRRDTTVPYKHSHVLRSALPNARFHVVEDSGHIPHYEKPEEVNPILLEFLRN